MGELILNTENSNNTTIQKNFMDRYPELRLRPSSLIPLIEDSHTYKKKRLIIFVIILVVTLLLFIYLGLHFRRDAYIWILGGAVFVICEFYSGTKLWKIITIKVHNSELAKISDYYQLDKSIENSTDPYIIILKDSKFGVWNFSEEIMQIAPEYDYLDWRENRLLLHASIGDESFVIDINGQRLP